MKKQELRKQYLSDRQALTRAQITSASQKIHDWLFQSFAVHSYSTIHVFLPIKEKNEVDTWLMLSTLQTDFKSKIVIPKVMPKGEMKHYYFNGRTKFEMNRWGVQEPIDDENLQAEETALDLIIIPLLAFDKKGNRVGYGKGFYDKFLAKCRPNAVKVGVSVFDPIEAIEDVEPTDIKLDYCITPKRVWQF
jgi:5-formyltetrahydrofolate cyclo-ligase